MSQPMIESARLRLSGLSPQTFDDPPKVGEQRTYTITATCTSRKEEEMKSEGKRWVHSMRLDQITEGVSDPEPKEKPEPSLFDQPPAHEPDEPEEGREPDPEEDEGASVSSIGSGFSGGPQFSAGDGE